MLASIRRFASVPELITAIQEFIAANGDSPKLFVWTASVDKILEKVGHCNCKAIGAGELDVAHQDEIVAASGNDGENY